MHTVDDILAAINPAKPVILVDADEVLLRFVERLEAYFLSQGFELRLTSFQLSGNIFHLGTNDPAEPRQVKQLIGSFFTDCVDDMAAVPGAADGLARLAEHFQIVVLSNVPQSCRARRKECLASLGMDYPIVANKGDKGPVIKLFKVATRAQTIFIDDLPPQHTSAADHCPDSYRVHFVADPRLAKMIGKAEHAHVRIDAWDRLTPHLAGLLEA
jgi:hypothetical protein